KWRFMRSCGVEEKYITGDASDHDKFIAWAKCLGRAIGNPLHHWSHLDLQRYFGYKGALNEKTAEEVWNLCNKKLQSPEMSARGLIKKSGVTLICTTDDPVDALNFHDEIKNDKTFNVQVLPAWRPDRAMNLEKPDYFDYLDKLSEAVSFKIGTYDELIKALKIRMDYFASKGCLVSDHGLDFVMYNPASKEEVDAIFKKRLSGGTVSYEEELKFKTAFLLDMGKEYKKKNWVMQLHYGCKRNNNTVMFNKIGPDTGFDCIKSETSSSALADFLNALNSEDALPKTILYSLNPGDNEAIGTILGCFQDSTAVAKIQQGSAWWFNDHKTGMERQMTSLASLGNLSGFVGMLTDSRSFLSYARHEYFRRILCNLIGQWVEDGEFPYDEDILSSMIKDISYNNAVRYFGFDLETK
ncbi:MAG: glucuronate isomerase, partial [Lachnospiraceae bacterium]|nr:glucuronate isomerase [Lachnospiraceae bacterium]